MASFSKQYLSGGSGNGRGISVTATATAGTLIHTAHASALDEIWLYVRSTHSAAVTLVVEFGGTTAASDNISQTIAVHPSGLVLVVPGIQLSGGLVVRAFCATTAVVSVFGYVNRIT